MLDKSVLVLEAVESGASTLAALTERTGLSRATVHRLAVALEVHRLLARDSPVRSVSAASVLAPDSTASRTRTDVSSTPTPLVCSTR